MPFFLSDKQELSSHSHTHPLQRDVLGRYVILQEITVGATFLDNMVDGVPAILNYHFGGILHFFCCSSRRRSSAFSTNEPMKYLWLEKSSVWCIYAFERSTNVSSSKRQQLLLYICTHVSAFVICGRMVYKQAFSLNTKAKTTLNRFGSFKRY